MTPRERVRLALEHREPDRVPIDNNGIVSSIHEVAYGNLLRHLGRSEDMVILDPVQRIVLASEKILVTLGVDTRYLYPNAPDGWEYRENPDGTWVDEFGTTYKRLGFYADTVLPPLRGKSFAEVKAYRFPDPTDPSRFRGLRDKARTLHETTDFALVSGSMICFDYIRWILRGLEDSVADLYEEPRLAAYLLDAIVDWMTAFGGALLSEIGDSIEFFWVGDDWGAQTSPFYSPQMFREVFKPRLQKLIASLKTHTRAKCAYHCCGSVSWVMNDLIEAGVDILHPLQPNAAGNGDSRAIKAAHGARLSFHGGTNNQGLFHGGSAAMKIDTLERLSGLAPGGGYIFSSGHNIQANMPAENILALFAAGRDFGAYPIDQKRIAEAFDDLRRAKDYHGHSV
ncbi:MAG: uroporphyrinogen decarboxylase family protein [Spirochaetia bacterium]|jgi:uroporphyrinogen decarboxylase